MFDFLKRKDRETQRLVVPAKGASHGAITPHLAAVSALRRRPTLHVPTAQLAVRGMWVMYRDSHPGILLALEPGDVATVVLTDFEKGENMQTIHCPAADVRQAWLEEIPVARRPTVERAAAFGYHSKPV